MLRRRALPQIQSNLQQRHYKPPRAAFVSSYYFVSALCGARTVGSRASGSVFRMWFGQSSIVVLTVAATAVQALNAASAPSADIESLPIKNDSRRHKEPLAYSVKSAFTLSPSLADEWQLQPHPPSPSYLMNLRFALRPRPGSHEKVEEMLLSNHPMNPDWTRRRHLTKDDTARLASPHPESIERLHAYLARHGIPATALSYAQHDTLQIKPMLPNVTVQLAERLLATRYYVYKHRTTGKEIVRTTEYSLPNELLDDIEWVQPTNYFGSLKAQRRTAHIEPASVHAKIGAELGVTDEVTYATNVTLAFLKELYNLTNYRPSTNAATSGNKLAITGWDI